MQITQTKKHGFTLIDQSAKRGFTLIELSIVLVIIGLIVGGVLVGQDLIKAAQIRATVGQIEKYDAAVNTFRGKYNGLPGDLVNCTNFFAAVSCTSDTSPVAGNSLLEDTAGTYVLLSGEQVMFFHHLYIANLISETAIIDGSGTGIDAVGQVPISTTYPAAKIGSGSMLYAYSVASTISFFPGMAGQNIYRIGGLTSDASSVPTDSDTLSPIEAFQIDSKKDDGVPQTGGVQAVDVDTETAFNATVAAPGAYLNTTCLSSATLYNTTSQANARLCQLMLRTSF
jgi:prepilin-type N-terminal cleavage/methylation domain-containing protein